MCQIYNIWLDSTIHYPIIYESSLGFSVHLKIPSVTATKRDHKGMNPKGPKSNEADPKIVDQI